MDEKTKKLIKERFDALPESIQEIILSSNYEDTLIEIGKQYQLNVEQMGILEQETTMTMMGVMPTKNFETELTRELGVDKSKGYQIARDINEKIFLRIRELLKLMNTEEGEEPLLEEKEETKNINREHEIMKSAGIEILNGKSKSEEKLPELEKLEIGTSKAEIHPILAQKLSSSVQNPTVKTEHTLENLSPNNTLKKTPKIDPYREIPE